MKKEAVFEGDSLDCIKGFPDDVKKVMGHNIDLLQDGKYPPIAKHWKGTIPLTRRPKKLRPVTQR